MGCGVWIMDYGLWNRVRVSARVGILVRGKVRVSVMARVMARVLLCLRIPGPVPRVNPFTLLKGGICGLHTPFKGGVIIYTPYRRGGFMTCTPYRRGGFMTCTPWSLQKQWMRRS